LATTLLLVHSWALQGRSPPLEVVTIGAAPSRLVAQLRELGAEVTPTKPHPVSPVSMYANKLLGLKASGDTAVLLLDNDVCFLDDVSDLDGRAVRAAVEWKPRLSEAQWEWIAAAAGLKPPEIEWIPPKEEATAKAKGRPPQPVQQLYLNGGVVWVRNPVAFAATWAAHTAAIAEAFDGHPLCTHWVRGDDQASLTTAVAEHGGFDLLPLAYNFQPWCIRLGLGEPKILHLARVGTVEQPRFSRMLTEWWEWKVFKRMKRDRKHSVLPEADLELERLLDDALALRARVLSLVADAGLDTFDFDP
jgi:hypothetical protein